ncbi:MAG: hypothetical protein GY702_19070 [Desulfobulbaceae bacterium]|nr:hypothetical protein [Desulfobulbaceae bacterium]
MIKDLLGVGPNCRSGDYYNAFMLAGSSVDPKIRSKIIAGEYVELSLLAPKDETPASLQMSFLEDEENQINFSAAKSKKPATLAEWSYLFYSYASIYLPHHPNEAAQLVTYMQRIADMHKEEPNTYIWRFFDEHFRRMREGCKEDPLPWHIHHPQTISNAKAAYFRSLSKAKSNQSAYSYSRKGAQTGGNRGRGRGRGQGQGQQNRSGNLCNRYNEGTCTFSPCKFTHLCSICRGVHPAINCKNGPSLASTSAATKKSK